MRPLTISATALDIAEKCLARFNAEMIKRGKAFGGGRAAGMGSCLHGTIEEMVRGYKIKGDTEWDLSKAEMLYIKHFGEIFGADFDVAEFEEGLSILRKWFTKPETKSDLDACKVISLETKHHFMVPVTIDGKESHLRLNYIMDRFDQLSDGVYRVLDYKSNRVPLTSDQLRRKIQARVYAVAAQLLHKDAKRIWVTFDFLRHEQIGTVFTLEDNRESWQYILRAAQRIVDADEKKPPETLNTDCQYCIRKHECKSLNQHIDAEGILSLSVDEMAVRLHGLQIQQKAIKTAADELELQLLTHADNNDTLTFETEHASVSVYSSSRRAVDRDAVVKILGPDLMMDIGKVGVTELDALIKSGRLTKSQQAEVINTISKRRGEPSIRVNLKDDIGSSM